MAKDEGNNEAEEQTGSSEDAIEVEGQVVEQLRNATFTGTA